MIPKILLSLMVSVLSMYLLQDVMPSIKKTSNKLKYYLTRFALATNAAFFVFAAFSSEFKIELTPYIPYLNSLMIVALFYDTILSKQGLAGPRD